MSRTEFLSKGWTRFDTDPDLENWLDSVDDAALATERDPSNALWHRHGKTWFAGVNALPNDPLGSVAGGPPLDCEALRLARSLYGDLSLDQAQVSIVYPGYPLQDPDERF